MTVCFVRPEPCARAHVLHRVDLRVRGAGRWCSGEKQLVQIFCSFPLFPFLFRSSLSFLFSSAADADAVAVIVVVFILLARVFRIESSETN